MPISATGNNPARLRRQRGFTLVEVMVVLFIAGLLAGAVALTMPARPLNAVQEAARFAAKARLAAEESTMTGAPVGLSVTADGYSFFRRRQSRWEVDSSKTFAPQVWGEGVVATLVRDGAKSKPQSKPDTTSTRPMIVFDPAGPSTPFDVVIASEGTALTVSGDEAGAVILSNARANPQVAHAR